MKDFSSWFFLGVLLLGEQIVFANPSDPAVTAGKADFHLNNKTLEVTAGDHTIISWESFSIDAKETTRFTLPNKDSVVLNRVSSLLPSTIDGHLNSNGIVYLINPNGILVTPNGIVDTAGFLASTLDISDQDFLKQGDLLFSGESLASVVNQGSISCWNGDAILIATQVKNENSIEAPEGVVGLASGHEVLLIPEGKEKITVRLKIQDSPSDGIGVHQTGSVQAIQAELKADGNLYAYAIKNEGIITATGVQEKEGRIFLVAEGGHATTSGSLAAATGDHGGEVHLLGDVVSLTGEAAINVSGNSGGGTVLIGGDFQGSNAAVLNSRNTFIEPKASIKADALQKGDGGKVIVWGDATTAFLGNISAKGGEEQGNGGFVEVSGEVLDFYGLVDTSAPQGKTGQLLLDPITATISNAVDSGFNIVLCPTGTYTPNGIAAAGNIQIAPLLTSLGLCNVTITSSGVGGGTGDISLTANGLTVSSNLLTINAFHNFTINNGITLTTAGTGSIAINAGTGLAGVITLTGPTGAITTAGSGTFAMSVVGASAATAIALAGKITHASTGSFTATATAGNILATNIQTFSAGAGAFTFTTTAANGDITFSTTGALVNNVTSGTSLMNAGRNISFTTTTSLSNGGNLSLKSGQVAVGATTFNLNAPITTSGTGTLSFTSNNAVGLTAITLASAITYNSTGTFSSTATSGNTIITGAITHSTAGAFNVTGTTGNIALGPAAIGFTGGSPVTIQTTPSGGTVTITAPTSFAGGVAGSLTVNSQGNLIWNNSISYSYTGLFDAKSATGNITSNVSGTPWNFNAGSGNATFEAPLGNITLNTAALTTMTFNAGAGNLFVTAGGSATLNNIIFNSGMNKAAKISASSTIAVRNFTSNSSGASSIISTGGPINTASGTSLVFNSGSLLIQSGSDISTNGAINFANTASFLTMNAVGAISNSNATGIITYNSPSPFTMTGASFGQTSTTPGEIIMNTPATLTMTFTNDITTYGRIHNLGSGPMIISCTNLTVGVLDPNNTTPIAQIGSANGDLTFTVRGNLVVQGSANPNTYAQIGFDTAPVNSNIIFTQLGGSISVTAGSNDFCYAIIGHGNQSGAVVGPGGSFTGNILFGDMANPVGGNVVLTGRIAAQNNPLGVSSFAQIGHMRAHTVASPAIATGDIDLSHVNGLVSLTAGNRNDSYALIGHGGGSSAQADTYNGKVQVSSGTGQPITLLTGPATEAFAAIGHIAFLNGPGTVTINSLLIEAISGNGILMQAMESAAVIGAYVSCTGMGAIGNVLVDSINVETSADLIMTGRFPSETFNGLLIGALSFTGGAPIAAAGSAGSNLTVNVGANLQMTTGIGGVATTPFALIQNGVGTPMGGPFSTTVNVTDAIVLAGGNNLSSIYSIGPLTVSSGASLALLANPLTGSSGDALIIGNGTTSVISASLDLLGFNGGPRAAIENSLGDLTVLSTDDISVIKHADIELGSLSSGTLSVTSTAGILNVNSNAFISNLGSGSVILNINQAGFIQGTTAGDATVSSNGALTANFGNELFVTSVSNGKGSIQSNGTTSITSTGRILGIGNSPGFQALIQNTAGDLSVSSTDLFFTPFAKISLAGTGNLTINALSDIIIGSNSKFENIGTGTSSVTASHNMIILASNFGPASISTLNSLSVAASNLTITGTIANFGSISATQGNLTLNTNLANIGPNASVVLSGGSGQLTAAVAEDLIITSNSSIQNLGSGNTDISAEVGVLIAGAGNAQISGGTGILTLHIIDNLNLLSDIDGSATITAAGPLNIFGATSALGIQNLSMGGLAMGQKSLIQSTGGEMLIIAQDTISIRDNALINNTALGAKLTLVVDNIAPVSPAIGPGRFILRPGANVRTNGGVLWIFTARPNGFLPGTNLAFGTANVDVTLTLPACPFDQPDPSPTYQYATYYPNGTTFGTPFTIFFKIPFVEPPPPPPPTPPTPPSPHLHLHHKLSKEIWASSELFFILKEYFQYTSERYFNECESNWCKRTRNGKKSQSLCDFFSTKKYPVMDQKWTRYPIEFPNDWNCDQVSEY